MNIKYQFNNEEIILTSDSVLHINDKTMNVNFSIVEDDELKNLYLTTLIELSNNKENYNIKFIGISQIFEESIRILII